MSPIGCSPIGLEKLSFSICYGIPYVAEQHSLAEALKIVRKARGLSQEAFSRVSSRTYMSALERDLKSPTISKLAELCDVMKVHPITLLTLAYGGQDPAEATRLLELVQQELRKISDRCPLAPSTLGNPLG